MTVDVKDTRNVFIVIIQIGIERVAFSASPDI